MTDSTHGVAPRSAHADETSGRWHDLFFYRRVLRAGWGLLLFVAAGMLLVAGQSIVLRSVPGLEIAPHTLITPHDALGSLVALVAVLGALAAVTLLEQRRFQEYGFATAGMGRLAALGLASGTAVLSGLVLALRGMGLLVLHRSGNLSAGRLLLQTLLWIAFYALVAFVEENLARGYLQYGLTRGVAALLRTYFGARSGVATAFWVAGVLLSIAYGALHAVNDNESTLGLCNAALLGLLLVASLWRTGSLWWAIGFHTAWDVLQTFLFGSAASGDRIRDHIFSAEAVGPAWQSGGVTGPEGSVFTVGALAVAFVLVLLLPRRQVYPELWAEAELDFHEHSLETLPDPDR